MSWSSKTALTTFIWDLTIRRVKRIPGSTHHYTFAPPWNRPRAVSLAARLIGSVLPISVLPMMPLFSFINIPKYSLKLASSLATILVKMNTFRGENKYFSPLKITAEVFFFYSPSPVNIKPLFPEKQEQIKPRVLISQLHVSGNGRSGSFFGSSLDACFSFCEKQHSTKKKNAPEI